MTFIETSMNYIFNTLYTWFNYFSSDSMPLIIRMLIFAPFFLVIVSLIASVFSDGSGGKTDL